MQDTFIHGKTFDLIEVLSKGEYEGCTFNNCIFANQDFSEFKFIACAFNSCNLSMMKLNKTVFQDIKFTDCKMLGLRFDLCHDFGLSFSFDHCQLNHSSFYKTKIKKTVFKNTQLQETDFADADLTMPFLTIAAWSKLLLTTPYLKKLTFELLTIIQLTLKSTGSKKQSFRFLVFRDCWTSTTLK